MLPYDVDHDGLLDLLMVGNDYGMELLQGRADAFCGLVLKNTGQNKFKALSLEESHFYVPYDARALARVNIGNGKELILATQHRGPLKVFAPKVSPGEAVVLQANEVKAVLTLKNGQKRTQEYYWGSTFLSQDSRSVRVGEDIAQIAFFDGNNKQTRVIGRNLQ